MEVALEPSGMVLLLEPGCAFEIVAESAIAGDFEIEHGTSSVVVYSWPGSMSKVYCDGALVHEESVEVPATPPGLSVRGFLSLVGIVNAKRPA